ncbi:insulinase family protein [uncultured Algibacter sp.]|uniref:M16 family metallopeptidase n=1 Tax=uncultured Algibacter sp. TaxID=298659 RepID=UPI00321645D6
MNINSITLKIKLVAVFSFLILLPNIIGAQVSTTIPLPKDIKHGKLANGINYYILKNQKPEGKASFYFLQNVGAIIEKDHEDGLAHFLEHMAFNGSKNFPGSGGIDKFLQSKGFVLGDQYNAFTDWNKTTYYVQRVPVKDKEFVDNIMLMMHDWAGYILLKGQDIDDERGVIEGEWTSIQNPFTDLDNKTLKTLYNNSRYSHRDVIGDVSFVKSFEHKLLRDFYKTWYRPDLQTVIIVGDVDLEDIENKIKKTFSEIPQSKNSPERPYFEIPKNKSSKYVLATLKDDKIKDITITIGFWNKVSKIRDNKYLRDKLVKRLFGSMINKRFQNISEQKTSPFKYSRANISEVTLFDAFTELTLAPKKGKNLDAFKSAYREIERVNKFGFLQSELDLEIKNLMTSYNAAINRELDKSNPAYANQLVSYVIDAKPMTSAQWNLDFAKTTLPTITLKEINEQAEIFQCLKKSTFIVKGPEDSSIDYPNHKALLKSIKQIKKEALTQIEAQNFDDIINKPFITNNLSIKDIKNEFSIDNIPTAKGYVLANGAKVVLIPSVDKGKNITMSATSPGGLSAVNHKDFAVMDAAISLARSSGLGEFSAADLRKKLGGKRIFIRPSYRTHYDLIEGSALESDFETLLKMTYLTFESPRFEKEKFDLKKEDWKEEYDTFYVSTDKAAFYNAINKVTFGDNPRNQSATIEDFDAVSFKKCQDYFKERYSNANDFNFIFIGNFENENVLPLIQKYIGNLSTKPITETFIEHKTTHTKGFTIKNVEAKEKLDATSVYYSLENKIVTYNLENDLIAKLIQSILETRYFTSVREEEGGTYGVNTAVSLTDILSPKLTLTVEFDCVPEKTERLLAIVKAEIAALSTTGPSDEDLKNAKTFVLDGRKESLTKNYFWEAEIQNATLFGKKHIPIETYENTLKRITPAMIQEFSKTYFLTSNGLQATYISKK